MKKSTYTAIIASTVLLASCASYTASPLCNPSADLIQTAPKIRDILVVSKTFSQEDCAHFLDRDVIGEGYQPVQIYIENNSDKTYLFSLNRISLPVARSQEVAQKVHTSTVGRAVGYGAGALIFWPLAIPAIVDGIKSSEANVALDIDFASKAAKEDQEIAAHSRFNAIIFVPKEGYKNSYTITLLDQKNQKPKIFNVLSNG